MSVNFPFKVLTEVTFGAAITACRRVLRSFLGQPWLQLHDVAQSFAKRQACHEMAKCPCFGEILSSKTRTFRLQMDEFRAKCIVVIMASIKVDKMALDNIELEPQKLFTDLCGVIL